MKARILSAVGALLLVALSTWAWYWYGYGAQAASLARSDDPDDRLQAIRILREKRNGLARRTLHRLCSDPVTHVAVHAVRGIGAMRQEQSEAILLEVIRQPKRGRLRGEAAAVLGHYDGTDLKLLTDIVRNDPDPDARSGALKGLARLRNVKALPALVEALSDSELKNRAFAIVAIQKVVGVRFMFDPKAAGEVRRRQVAQIVSFLSKHKLL